MYILVRLTRNEGAIPYSYLQASPIREFACDRGRDSSLLSPINEDKLHSEALRKLKSLPNSHDKLTSVRWVNQDHSVLVETQKDLLDAIESWGYRVEVK